MKQKNRDGASSVSPCTSRIAKYNAIMGGGDCLDQRRYTYAVGRYSLK
jgi:hypothetical protein